MDREKIQPRAGWQEKVEALGFRYHTENGIPYWCEDACYVFRSDQINQIEEATEELHQLCLAAVEKVIASGDLDRLAIPEIYWPYIADSWRRQDPDIYGRFDLAFDGSAAPKMLEYNADTPTALLEASVVQWYWLEETRPDCDQFNSIHERLIEGWAQIKNRFASDWPIHFSGLSAEDEDLITVEYMRDVCQQAGLATRYIDIADIGWNGRCFTDLDERPLHVLFKLYPWEWLLQEEFGRHVLADSTAFIEPPWKMILSTKAILPILWEMFPGHPNLLPASFTRADFSGPCVEKPLHGREGSGVRILPPGESAPVEGDERRIWQGFVPLPTFDGKHALIGSWVVCGVAAGMGIREDASPITGNSSLFVPHYFI